MNKMISLLMAAILMAGVVTGCSNKEAPSSSQPEQPDNTPVVLKQYLEPEPGTEIATIKTSAGEIQVMFFPQEAPKAVENFITNAKEGYYDGLIFHRVISGFMIQGGSPEGDGIGGKSIYGEPFEDEFSDNLHHFRGALAMANSGFHTNSSQFFIVQNKTPITEEDNLETALFNMYMNKALYEAQVYLEEQSAAGKSDAEINELVEELNEQLSEKSQQGVPDSERERLAVVLEKYKEVGGTPFLDNKHTVFGQVIAGMDIVDKIAAMETDANDKPLTPVVIESITFSEVK